MKIAVIDDEKYAREELCHQISEILPEAQIQVAASGVAAMELIERTSFDLLFLDIRLGDMMGTTIASLVRKASPHTHIVFATAFPEYGVKAFELGVDDYILKPFDPQRVRQVIARCQSISSAVQETAPVQKIAITTNRHTTLVGVEDIIYIETAGTGRHCILHTRGGNFTTTTSLTEYEGKLQPLGFFRIHKTCLVQLKLVRDIFPWTNNGFGLHVEGSDAVLPIGREQMKRLRQLLNLNA